MGKKSERYQVNLSSETLCLAHGVRGIEVRAYDGRIDGLSHDRNERDFVLS